MEKKRRPPYGFVFLGVEETEKLQHASRKAQDILRSHGYLRVMPAGIDFPETFVGYGSSGSFRMRDKLGEDLALRSDVTVQVIKGFATEMFRTDRIQENPPWKFYYTVPVFHDVQKNYPTLREIYQTGAECIGLPEEEIVPDLIEIAYQILAKEFKLNTKIVLGYIRLLRFLLSLATDAETLLQTIYYRDVPEFAAFLENFGIENSEETAYHLLYFDEFHWEKLYQNVVRQKNVSAKFLEFFHYYHKTQEKLCHLKKKISIPPQTLQVEPLLVRKTEYYTGLIFEGYVEGLSFPPLRGGAYDDLLALYGGKDFPASGFALDVSSVVLAGMNG